MLKVAVLDDEKIFCESIREQIYSIYRNMHVAVEVDDYHFSRELLYEVDDEPITIFISWILNCRICRDGIGTEIKGESALLLYYIFDGISPVCDRGV